MVYFAYGCPVTHRVVSTGAIDKVLLSKWGSDLLLVVTQRTVQMWGSKQHRIKLGEICFDEGDVNRYGVHVCAAWCSETRSIAAMTDKGYLIYYSYSDSKEFPWSIDLEIPIASIDIAMKAASNISTSSTVSGERMKLAKAVGMYADAQSVTLVFQSGDFWRFDWSGKKVLSSSPLENMPSKLREELRIKTGGGKQVDLLADFISQVAYLPSHQLLYLLMENGAVALAKLTDEGLRNPDAYHYLQWVHLPRDARDVATSVAIQPLGHLIAIGIKNSGVKIIKTSSIKNNMLISTGMTSSEQNMDSEKLLEKKWTSTADADGAISAKLSALELKMLSLAEWGHAPSCLGAVSSISWSADGRVVAVGYERKGVVVWTPSGCRVFCTLGQGPQASSIIHGPLSPNSPEVQYSARRVRVFPKQTFDSDQALSPNHEGIEAPDGKCLGIFEHGVEGLSWSIDGGSMLIFENECTEMIEITFGQCCGNHVINVLDAPMHRDSAQNMSISTSLSVLLAADRILLVSPDVRSMQHNELKSQFMRSKGQELPDLGIIHVRTPQQYIESAYPVRLSSLNFAGTDVLVAGKQGFCIYHLAQNRWRLFGDITQEKELDVAHIKWLTDDIIVACSKTRDGACKIKSRLYFYPKNHLDVTSLMGSYDLRDVPSAFNVSMGRICIVFPNQEIQILEAVIQKKSSAKGPNRISLSIKFHVQPKFGFELGNISSIACMPSKVPDIGPEQCILLHEDGCLTSLNLDDGTHQYIAKSVQYFWVPERPAVLNPEGKLMEHEGQAIATNSYVELPCWMYGSDGIRLWFVSDSLKQGKGYIVQSDLDPELEFDQEVLPIGISLSAVSIIGIAQRIRRSAMLTSKSSLSLSFHPLLESQPVLPCLLRRLLLHDKFHDALALADLYSHRPHFLRSLEWLLFTSLEANIRFQKEKGLDKKDAGEELAKVTELVLQFPQAAELVVSVARKTEAELWPPLFQAAGSPVSLCEGLLRDGSLQSAACCLLVVNEMVGKSESESLALKTLRASISVGNYDLAADLVRFLAPEHNESEENNADQSQASMEKSSNNTEGHWIWGWFSSAVEKKDSKDRVLESLESRRRLGGHDTTKRLHEDVKQTLHQDLVNLAPDVAAWRSVAKQGWKLLDSGAIRELSEYNRAMKSVHGGLVALFETTVGISSTSLGHMSPSASSIASALFVASNELASCSNEEWDAALDLLQSLLQAKITNYAIALAIISRDEQTLRTFAEEHPRVWTNLSNLISNDVHLCSFSSIVNM